MDGRQKRCYQTVNAMHSRNNEFLWKKPTIPAQNDLLGPRVGGPGGPKLRSPSGGPCRLLRRSLRGRSRGSGDRPLWKGKGRRFRGEGGLWGGSPADSWAGIGPLAPPRPGLEGVQGTNEGSKARTIADNPPLFGEFGPLIHLLEGYDPRFGWSDRPYLAIQRSRRGG